MQLRSNAPTKGYIARYTMVKIRRFLLKPKISLVKLRDDEKEVGEIISIASTVLECSNGHRSQGTKRSSLSLPLSFDELRLECIIIHNSRLLQRCILIYIQETLRHLGGFAFTTFGIDVD